LNATGEHVSRGDATTAERLTPQEFQVATLVAEGLTNRETAARLYLSQKTIEFHLGRVYRKLDVRTRGELIRLFSTNSHDFTSQG
jgi:DNA-binding CsgD family transcriptional regulator